MAISDELRYLKEPRPPITAIFLTDYLKNVLRLQLTANYNAGAKLYPVPQLFLQ